LLTFFPVLLVLFWFSEVGWSNRTAVLTVSATILTLC
jgi:hypothetical protein